MYAARVTDARKAEAAAADPAACRGCGGRHFATERVCPLTKRPIDEGAFGAIIGPYRVGKLLGAGGFSIVHLAEDTRTQTRVALKLLHPELVADREQLDRFVREAEVTVRAGNPHIVRVLEASFTGRTAYVALELLSGETLASALRSGPMPAVRAVDIAIQLLDGLAVAHAAGVIHRDIKPANVFLADGAEGPRSLVKILDFGIGRLLVADARQRLTRTGAHLGTPHFMAPEQLTDAKRADARADLYAVAVTLYAMLSGALPYGTLAIGEWVALVARGAAPPRVKSPLERLPEALVDVVTVALSLDAAQRFQDAGAFARALLDAFPESPALTRALPALAQSPTFASAATPTYIDTRPGRDARRDMPDPIPPTRSHAHPPARSDLPTLTAMIVGAALFLLLAAVSAIGVGLLLYSRSRDALTESGSASGASLQPAPLQTPTSPVLIPTPTPPALIPTPTSPALIPTPSGGGVSLGPMPPGALVPGLGVHFAEPSVVDGEVDLTGIRALLQNDLQSFERCRVLGRATHASVMLGIEENTGRLSYQGPDAIAPNDTEVSRCVAARFSEAAVGVRFGHGPGAQVRLSAELDPL